MLKKKVSNLILAHIEMFLEMDVEQDTKSFQRAELPLHDSIYAWCEWRKMYLYNGRSGM